MSQCIAHWGTHVLSKQCANWTPFGSSNYLQFLLMSLLFFCSITWKTTRKSTLLESFNLVNVNINRVGNYWTLTERPWDCQPYGIVVNYQTSWGESVTKGLCGQSQPLAPQEISDGMYHVTTQVYLYPMMSKVQNSINTYPWFWRRLTCSAQ